MRETYQEKVRRNLLAVSDSDSYSLAAMEWELQSVYSEPFRCELCGHPIIHNFKLRNLRNGNFLRVGCCCVVNYVKLAGLPDMEASNRYAVAHQERLEREYEEMRMQSVSYAREMDTTMGWVRTSMAPFSDIHLSKAFARARSEQEKDQLKLVQLSKSQRGYVDKVDWNLVTKLCRRTRVSANV
jgi:hypothetical protein